MLPAAEALVAEIDSEAPITRRVLERLPADRYDWRPHPKSLSAGELARHVATIPGNVARLMQQDGFDVASRPVMYPPAEGPAALLAALNESVAAARDMLAGLDATRANAPWTLTFKDREVFCLTRLAVIRTMGLNHWYHHRGELVVYLRLLDVPVPVVYGRSADENPFT
ncbi:MAG: DinB family protein [Vicinamibacteria bacterium]